ncbi:Actin- protein 6 [Coemansia sp. RSA 2610]|nr:Actin- protein 6 [Coemansia sp. RSA 2610]
MRTLVVDNGSFAIKCGFADDGSPHTIPNAVTRTRRTKQVLVGDLADSSTDLAGLYYRTPFERGYLTRWDVQLAVWDRVLSDRVLACAPSDTHLILTEPQFNFGQIKRSMDEIVFEEYGFASLVRAPASRLSVLGAGDLIYGGGPAPDCALVVDCGHAFTHIVPYAHERAVTAAVRRVDVGGRLLTNYLKETVSFRYWDMMDETYIMNAVKEKCCFVSQDFARDLECARAKRQCPYALEYVLPDFTTSKQGFIRGPANGAPEGCQLLPLCNERFAVPEALFHPLDVGIEQLGIHEAVVQAVGACPEPMRAVLLANIVLTGGTAALPGLAERLQREVQALATGTVRVVAPDAPMRWAWRNGCRLAEQPGKWRVTRAQYEEMGGPRTIAHFDSFL